MRSVAAPSAHCAAAAAALTDSTEGSGLLGIQIEKERQTKRDLRQVKVDQAEGLQRQLGDEQFQGAAGPLSKGLPSRSG